jgi:hypothetical protein
MIVFLRIPQGIGDGNGAAIVVTDERPSFNGEGFEKGSKKTGVTRDRVVSIGRRI